MFLDFLIIIFLGFLSGMFYRMGGSGNYPRWVRPVGCSSCLMAVMFFLGLFHWSMILCFGLQYAAVTTYFKNKGSEAKWWNWLLVGIATAAAILPIVIFLDQWIPFAIRSIALTMMTILWSELNGNAVVEEFGRGALIILTFIPFLFTKNRKGSGK